jgi:hypothetical protein
MTSGFEREQLDSRHLDTLRQIFQHPTSHNIEWRAVKSLLEAIGAVTVRHDGKFAVQIGGEKEILDPPRGKDIDTQMVVDLRRILTAAGYSAPGMALFTGSQRNDLPPRQARQGIQRWSAGRAVGGLLRDEGPQPLRPATERRILSAAS